MARNREFNTETVLDKAIELFWNKGFNGVSTQELIDGFGISKSSMYGAFGDKMKLFIAALKRYSLNATSVIELRLEQTEDVKKEICAIISDMCKHPKIMVKGCFIVNSATELAPHNKEIADIVLAHQLRLKDAFTNAIKRGIKNGEIAHKENPECISMTICNTISGMHVDTKYIRDKKYFDSVINSIGELLNSAN